jgi:hypothetical protein
MSELHAVQRLIAHLEEKRPSGVSRLLIDEAREELDAHRRLSRLLRRMNVRNGAK